MSEISKFKLREFVGEFLESNPGHKYTAREIAEALVVIYPDEAEAKRTESEQHLDEAGLVTQIQAEIGAARNGIERKFAPWVRSTAERPRRFYWASQGDMRDEDLDSLPESDDTKSMGKTGESDLYPVLAAYLGSQLSVVSMRLDEKRSSGKKGSGASHWLHPDVVGIQDIARDWVVNTKKLADFYRPDLIKLWSVEVKVSLTLGNVRSAFFQAVSNSSWANYGWLAAESIDENARAEVAVLSNAHGIGLIRIDTEDASNGEILIPAKERQLDWQSIDRLADENEDFRAFLRHLERVHQTGDVGLIEHAMEKTFRNKQPK